MMSKIKKFKSGFVALIFVIMITSVFIVSSVIIAMVNTSNNMANYQMAEADDVMYNIDACFNDALWQIASSTSVAGAYTIAVGGVNCDYQISATSDNMKTVTSTATTTSGVGSWNRSVVMRVNVASSPFFIQSYKDYMTGFIQRCGDSDCSISESCSTCETDCGVCPPSSVCGDSVTEGTEVCDDGDTVTETQTCGNSSTESGTFCNADCSVVVTLTEVCDDGDTSTEACGNSATESGTFCNADCSASFVLAETCDDGNVNTERCGDGVTQGVGSYCNATCNGTYAGGETCDDSNTSNEICGDGTIQSGSYCNSNCSAVLTKTETCEFLSTNEPPYCPSSGLYCGMCSTADVNCPTHESPASGRCSSLCVWAACTKLCCPTCAL